MLSVAELARRLGTSRHKIQNYEAGRAEPSSQHLAQLCALLGCSIGALLRIESAAPAPRFAWAVHRWLARRKHLLIRARQYLRAYREIEEISEVRNAAEGIHLRWTHLANTHRRDAATAPEECAERACDYRLLTGRNCPPAPPIASALEALGVRCVFVESRHRSWDALAVMQADQPFVLLNGYASLAEHVIHGAARELGHLLLHQKLFMESDAEPPQGARRYCEQARRFADHWLVPTHALRETWHSERLDALPRMDALLVLKQTFRVSFWCLFRRMKEGVDVSLPFETLAADMRKRLGLPESTDVRWVKPEPLEWNLARHAVQPADSRCICEKPHRRVQGSRVTPSAVGGRARSYRKLAAHWLCGRQGWHRCAGGRRHCMTRARSSRWHLVSTRTGRCRACSPRAFASWMGPSGSNAFGFKRDARCPYSHGATYRRRLH